MTKAVEWANRVRQWRASGQRSREFCEGKGYSAKNLLWWSSYLRRKGLAATSAGSGVALARIVRRAEVLAPAKAGNTSRGVVIELSGVSVRVDAGADRATLAMVLDVLRPNNGVNAR
jgi:hypothetical protein